MSRRTASAMIATCLIVILLIAGLAAAVRAQSAATHPTVAVDQAGPGFTFQGLLEDNGSVVNGSCDIQAGLWDAQSDGEQIGSTQTADDVMVEDGRFTITLNAGGEFGAGAFTGQARWLEIAVSCPAGNGDFSTLQPRQPLTAAPYAHSLLPGAIISGSVGTGSNATLSLSNPDANGVGLRLPDSGLDSIFIDRAGRNGIFIASTQQDGIFICAAGVSAGCGNYPTINGIEINQTQGSGMLISSPGESGLYVGNAGWNGVDVAGDQYAGYFYGAVAITGGCTGCTLANFGINTGTTELLPGDVVVLNGSRIGRTDAVPVLMEVAQANGTGAVVGVVMGRAEEITVENPRPIEFGKRLIPREGAAQSGELVTIVTYGLAPVRIDDPNNQIAVGQRLTPGANGTARTLQTVEVNGVALNEAASILGMALESGDTDGDGLVWVLVNPN